MRMMRTGFVTVVVTGHALVVVGAVLVASLIRFGRDMNAWWGQLLANPLLALAGFVVLAMIVFNASGLYRFDDRWTLRSEMADAAKAVALLAAITLMLLYLFKLEDVSRLFLLAMFGLMWAGLTVTTMGVHKAYARRKAAGKGTKNVLVVGTNPAVLPLIDDLTNNHPELGIRIVGYLGSEPGLIGDVEYRGRPESLSDVLVGSVIDEVIIAPDTTDLEHLDVLVQMAMEQGKTVRVPLPTMGRSIRAGTIETVDGNPMLTVPATSTKHISMATKRLIDIVGAALALVIFSPVLLITAIAIRLRDGSPVLFSQTRVGFQGRQFRLFKFRSMVVGAEELQSELVGSNERSGPAFKISDDPRMTRTGGFIRRTSIDELPQLWNVLVGTMSLVGPRPPLPGEVNRYDHWHMRRLSMKPGITGLWQVRYRTSGDFDSWVEADLEYIDSWSPALDLRILVSTVPAVLKMTGS